MPIRPVGVALTLLACASVAAAADVTDEYSYEDIAAGRDIHEGVYAKLSGGEFDEFRLQLGVAPGIDRVQVSSSINGAAYPGPALKETDRAYNDPALPTQIALTWILGDFDEPDQGWYYSLGLEFTQRQYLVLYGVGSESSELDLNALALHIGMGYAWYLDPRWRVEIEPFVAAGLMWTELDLFDVSETTPLPANKRSDGPLIEAGLRTALVWHPQATQEWHIGAALDYRAGYAQTHYKNSGPGGDVESEYRLWWYGFGASLFYGQRF